MSTDLKPCPFCGSATTLDDERLLWVASCTGCGACVLGDRAPEPEQEMPAAYWEPFRQSAVDRWNRRAALAQPAPTPPLEPRGCPTPGACSCPTAPTVPPDLIRALELAEAGLSDIGDADREPGDDLVWAEARAAQDLPRIRRTLNTWRDHSALAQPEPVAPTDEQWDALKERVWGQYQTIGYQGERFMYDSDFDTALDVVRQKLTRWGTPTIHPVPVSERLPGPEDCDAEGGCCWAIGERGNWMCVHVIGRSWSNPIYTHWLPHNALPTPEATNA